MSAYNRLRYIALRGSSTDSSEAKKGFREAAMAAAKPILLYPTLSASTRQGDFLASGVTALLKVEASTTFWADHEDEFRAALPEGATLHTYEDRPLSGKYAEHKANKYAEYKVATAALNYDDDDDDGEDGEDGEDDE